MKLEATSQDYKLYFFGMKYKWFSSDDHSFRYCTNSCKSQVQLLGIFCGLLDVEFGLFCFAVLFVCLLVQFGLVCMWGFCFGLGFFLLKKNLLS